MDPEYNEARFALGVTLVEKKDLDAAMNEFNQCIKVDSKDSDAYYGLGFVFYKKRF